MNVAVDFDGDEVAHNLTVAIEGIGDLTPIFKRFTAWLRPEIEKVFEQQGPGWAPNKQATKKERLRTLSAKAEAIRSRSLGKLGRSVQRTLTRAERRLSRTSASKSELVARRQRTVAKQQRQTAEIQRVIREGGSVQSGREFRKLGERVEKYRQRAEERISALERGEALGRIASSIRTVIEKNVLTIESAIDWAGVHNDGGTAGRGARIPKRTFLEWTPERIDKFVEIAQKYVAEKMQGPAA